MYIYICIYTYVYIHIFLFICLFTILLGQPQPVSDQIRNQGVAHTADALHKLSDGTATRLGWVIWWEESDPAAGWTKGDLVKQVFETYIWSSGLSFRHLSEQVRNHVINCGFLLHDGQPAMGKLGHVENDH